MKQLLQHAVFLLAIVAAVVWTGAHWPHRCTPFLAYAELLPASPGEGANKSATPAQQYQTLQKEFSNAAYDFWQLTADDERTQLVARVEKLPLKLLELAQNNPKDPAALDALIQVVTVDDMKRLLARQRFVVGRRHFMVRRRRWEAAAER